MPEIIKKLSEYSKIINKDTKKSGLQKNGETLLDTKYDSLYRYPETDFFLLKENDKYHLFNADTNEYILKDCDSAGVIKNAIITKHEDILKIHFIKNHNIQTFKDDFINIKEIKNNENLLLVEINNNKTGIINVQKQEYELNPVFNEIKYIDEYKHERYFLVQYKGLFGISKKDNQIFVNAIHDTKEKAIETFKEKISQQKDIKHTKEREIE